MRLLYGMTSGISAPGFIQGQPAFMRERGWETHLVCTLEGGVDAFAASEGLVLHPIAMVREPAPADDLRSLLRLVALVRRLRPDVALWGSPKASLLGTAACRLLGIPSVYVIHGLRLEGASGLRRRVLTVLEAVTCRLATRVLVDGEDLRTLVARLRICPADRLEMVAHGSANGVPDTFRPPRHAAAVGIPPDAPVVGFVGRITHDKGVSELAAAWQQVSVRHPGAHLVVAGSPDGDGTVSRALVAGLRKLPRTHLLGHLNDVDALYGDLDLLVLPSHREGLPLVVLEAAAAGVPAVVTDCTGCREAVVDDVTGRVVPVGDVDALGRAIEQALASPERMAEWGRAARDRARSRYGRQELWTQLEAFLRATADGARKHGGTSRG